MRTRPGYFGKLPTHGDFLRSAEQFPLLGVLDQWVEAGVAVARQSWGQRFEERWDGTHPFGFCICPRDARLLLLGLIHPSSDEVGRRFPFLACAQVDAEELVESPWLCAAASTESLRGTLETLVRLVQQSAEPAVVEAAVRDLEWEFDVAGASERMHVGLREAVTERFLAEDLGIADTRRRSLVFLDLKDALAKYPPRYAIRVPSRCQPISVAFWMQLVMAWSPGKHRPLLCTWDLVPGPEGGSISFVFDGIEPRYLEALLEPRSGADAIFDLNYASAPASRRQANADALFESTLRAWGHLSGLLTGLSRLGSG